SICVPDSRLPKLCVRSAGKWFVTSGSSPEFTSAVTVTVLVVVGIYGVIADDCSSCAPQIWTCVPVGLPGAAIFTPTSTLPVLVKLDDVMLNLCHVLLTVTFNTLETVVTSESPSTTVFVPDATFIQTEKV